MNEAEFNSKLEKLSGKPKEVLLMSLKGYKDEDIRRHLGVGEQGEAVDTSCVRHHIGRACKHFGCTNEEGKSDRSQLTDVFRRFKPDLVAPSIREKERTQHYPGSPMEVDSHFYIKPSLEERCFEKIWEPGALIRLRSPQQMGKTSLLHRILNNAQEKDCSTVFINVRQHLDASCQSNLTEFWGGFGQQVVESLALEEKAERALPKTKRECTNYFQGYILPQSSNPLLLVLDEADQLFEYPEIAKEFFPLLRGWHNFSKTPGMEIWKRMRLIIAHSTDDYSLLDRQSSPFDNVGFVGRLLPFNIQQVQELAKRYELHELKTAEIDRLMSMVGGHPYLIQQALYCLKQENLPLDELLESAPTLTGIYRSHLQNLSDKLQPLVTDRPEVNLYDALQQVIISDGNVQLTQKQTFKLEGLGLVQLVGNQVRISCELYRRFFQAFPKIGLTTRGG
jgi:hypothetical protein